MGEFSVKQLIMAWNNPGTLAQIWEKKATQALESFPSNTKKKPQEQVQAITTREPEEQEKNADQVRYDRSSSTSPDRSYATIDRSKESRDRSYHTISYSKDLQSRDPNPNIPLPFPTAVIFEIKEMRDTCRLALERMKKVHINNPFIDEILQMPNNVLFVSAAFSYQGTRKNQGKIVLKQENLRSPTIPCSIGKLAFENVLCNWETSDNLLPYSVFKHLGLEKKQLSTTGISLQLADGSRKQPMGLIENIIIKVGNFYFPGNFVVGKEFPLILGRPFLVTSDAKFKMGRGEITLRVRDEAMKIKTNKFLKHPTHCECYSINSVTSRLYEFQDIKKGDGQMIGEKETKEPPDLEERLKAKPPETYKGWRNHMRTFKVPRKVIKEFLESARRSFPTDKLGRSSAIKEKFLEYMHLPTSEKELKRLSLGKNEAAQDAKRRLESSI